MSTSPSAATHQLETADMESTTPTSSPSVEASKMDTSTLTPVAKDDTNTAPNIATPSLFSRIMSKISEFLMPTFLRREYSNILNTLAEGKYAYLALALAIIFGIAEYQQPGYFPRPEEWTYALVGFICAGALVFGLFALMAYEESHTWPWEDDGWVWPWEALLWSNTVYLGDDEFDLSASVTGYMRANKAASPRVDSPLGDGSGTEDGGWSVVSDKPSAEPSTGNDDPLIPPTPFLPQGMRPVSLRPVSPVHRSGLLGESPIKFKHFSGNGFVGPRHGDIKEEEEEA